MSTPRTKQDRLIEGETQEKLKDRKPSKPYNTGGGGVSFERMKNIPKEWPIHPKLRD